MKKISALLLAVVPFILFAQPSFSEFELYHYLDLGKELYDQGKYDAAIEEFNMLIRRDPQNQEAFQYRGNAFFRTRRYEEAIKDYDLAIELSHRQARQNDFYRYKKPDIREIDIIEPESDKSQSVEYAMLYNNRGAAKYHIGRFEEAIQDFEQAEKISPELTTATDNANRASRMASRYTPRYDESRYSDSRYNNSPYQESRNKDSRNYNNTTASRNSRYVSPRNATEDRVFKIEDRPNRTYSDHSTNSRYTDDRRYTTASRQTDDFAFNDPSTYNSSSRVNNYSSSQKPYSRNTSTRNTSSRNTSTRNFSSRNTSDRSDNYSRNTRPYQPTKVEDLSNRTPRYEPQYDSKRSTYNSDSKYQRYEPRKTSGTTATSTSPRTTTNRNTPPTSGRTTISDWWKSRRQGNTSSKKETTDRRRESLFGSKKKPHTFKSPEVRGQTARYVEIESIVNEEKSTMVHFRVTNYEREPLRLFLERPNDEGAYFITDADTRREYRMIRAFGLNLRPYETIVEVGQSINFSIEFERLDDKTDRIHILEGNYETDTRWNFYDVRLK